MRSSFGRAALLLIPLTLCLACATNPAPDGAPSKNLNVLTYEDLEQGRFTDLYDAIQALRSNWLIPRGTDSFRTPSQVLVVYDDTQLGDVSTLRSINIKSVVYVRYYNGVDATARWGIDHGAGVIFVSSRNTPKGEAIPPATETTTEQ